jgi:UDP-2,4-diacetamido-2,4,6-trideoxy-beta-L-altropyranose hydrolase
MKAVFRVDASLQSGTGHVMRCLTLAAALKIKDVHVEFICRKHEGHLIDYIQARDFKVHVLSMRAHEIDMLSPVTRDAENILDHAHWLGVTQQQDADACEVILQTQSPDWLIVDHYGIDQTWHKKLQGFYKKLMVIDDLGDRKQLCDILLDQNYGDNQNKYQSLVPARCKILVGSTYSLLRPEFAQWREYSLSHRLKPKLKKILITMGGVDPDNYTGQVLQALKQTILPKDIVVSVILGPTSPHLNTLQQQAKILPYKTEIKVNVSNMAELMANADLAIGAAGSTSWERCCLGLPSIQIVIAGNQKIIAENLSVINAINYIKNIDEINDLIETTAQWMQRMSQISSQVCDGMGTGRVIKHLI